MVKIKKKLYLLICTITKYQYGFRPGDFNINKLIDLINEIHYGFESTESLELRVVFLDISEAFD